MALGRTCTSRSRRSPETRFTAMNRRGRLLWNPSRHSAERLSALIGSTGSTTTRGERSIRRSERVLRQCPFSWIARLSSALGQPDMSHWRGGVPVKWQFPDRGLRLEATIDAVTEDGKLVMVAPVTEPAEAKAAYAAIVFVAARDRVPGDRATCGHFTSGKTRSLGVAEILDRGIQTAESAARAVIAASSGELSGLSRTPSYFDCRDCPGLGQCSEGQDLLHQPMTVSGGMRVR